MRNADHVLDIDRRFAGEPCAVKVASTVRRGAVGKAFPLGKQLAGRLPYIWDCRFSESMNSLLSPVDIASKERILTRRNTTSGTATVLTCVANCTRLQKT